MVDDGYVKFQCDWVSGPEPALAFVEELNRWRQRLFALRLIGMYDNGIGFGNLSLRVPGTNRFVITATATGSVRELGAKHYTIVNEVDPQANWVSCVGPASASSESMTHAVLYELAPDASAVIHAHGPSLWRAALDQYPATRPDVPYGTPQMVDEVRRLFRETSVAAGRFFVMAGHEEGVVSFGESLDAAGERLLEVAAALGSPLPEVR